MSKRSGPSSFWSPESAPRENETWLFPSTTKSTSRIFSRSMISRKGFAELSETTLLYDYYLDFPVLDCMLHCFRNRLLLTDTYCNCK